MKEIKNIFSLCMGMVLRRARERRGWSYEDLAIRTNIKPSYLLAFEKANAIFHISKAYAIYKAFANGEQHEFSLDGLISMFFLISYTDSAAKEKLSLEQEKVIIPQIEKNRIYNSCLSEYCNELTHANVAYQALLRPFIQQDVFGIIELNQLINYIEDKNLDAIIEKYVYDPIQFRLLKRKENRQYCIDYFSEIPTRYIPYLNNVKNDLQQFPTVTSNADYIKWFNLLRNNIRDITILTTEENIEAGSILDKIDFDFRFNNHFSQMAVYICNSFGIDYISSTIKSQYSLRNESRQSLEGEIKVLNEKLSIRLVDSERLKEQFGKRIKKQLTVENTELATTFCLISVANSLPIGFLLFKSIDKIVNLTVEEVEDWVNFIEEI